MKDVLKQALEAINQVLLGKPQAVKLAVACILARGHLQILDQQVKKTHNAASLSF